MQSIADRLARNEETLSDDAFIHDPLVLDTVGSPEAFKDAVDRYVVHFSVTKRKMFARWIVRARRLAPLIRDILKDNGLPDDLVYLAIIESGLNPRAYSCRKASGPWQFIEATGERYGLRIDHWIDERRHLEKSTIAAAQYLKDLFDRFGCWYLAASGYNAGERRIEEAIRRHGTSDYWKLYAYNTLPRETREYIPQLIAAAAIMENPERYGFPVYDEEEDPGFVRMKVPGGTPLGVIARVAGAESAEIKSLNPEILTRITPPGDKPYVVKLPTDASLYDFDDRLAATLKRHRVVKVIRVKTGGRRKLAGILRKYGLDRKELALVNRGTVSGRERIVYVPLFHGSASFRKGPAAALARVKNRKRAAIRAPSRTGHPATATYRAVKKKSPGGRRAGVSGKGSRPHGPAGNAKKRRHR